MWATGVQSPGMKKNWIRVAGTLALFVAVLVGVYFISLPQQTTDIAVKPGTQAAHLLRSDFKHPEPVAPVAVVEVPADTGSDGGGYTEPDPAPYVPTCEDQGLYTVDGSCVADLCYSYGDLDGDGVATDCLGRYY